MNVIRGPVWHDGSPSRCAGVEGKQFRLVRLVFGLGCHVRISFVCITLSGDASDEPEAGAASPRKIGGNRLRGNRFSLLTRGATADVRGKRCPTGVRQSFE